MHFSGIAFNLQLMEYIDTNYIPAMRGTAGLEMDMPLKRMAKRHNRLQGKQQELIPIADNKFVKKGVEDQVFEFQEREQRRIYFDH
jgi:hypothetical protein